MDILVKWAGQKEDLPEPSAKLAEILADAYLTD
jgi:hypothetical protein